MVIDTCLLYHVIVVLVKYIPFTTMKKKLQSIGIILVIILLGYACFRVENEGIRTQGEVSYYKKRLQPTIGTYYEVVQFTGYKDSSVFVITSEVVFHGDFTVSSRNLREIELPMKDQIGNTGKYLTLVTVDGKERIRNFKDLEELHTYRNAKK